MLVASAQNWLGKNLRHDGALMEHYGARWTRWCTTEHDGAWWSMMEQSTKADVTFIVTRWLLDVIALHMGHAVKCLRSSFSTAGQRIHVHIAFLFRKWSFVFHVFHYPVVVVTFFNHNFVNCKASCTLIWRLKIYEIKYNISLNNVHT